MTTGWASIDAALSALGLSFGAPTPGQTTGGSHVPDSEHYQGRARDYGSAGSDPGAIARALLPYAEGPDAPIDELFYSPLGIFYKNGAAFSPSDSLRQEHYDHVHVGVRPNTDLAADVAGGAGAGATLASFPGSGVIGDLLSPLRSVFFTVVFVGGGVTLLVLGAMRFVRKGQA
jgi:hypothetical protein